MSGRLLIRTGCLLDPSSGSNEIGDVAIADDKVIYRVESRTTRNGRAGIAVSITICSNCPLGCLEAAVIRDKLLTFIASGP